MNQAIKSILFTVCYASTFQYAWADDVLWPNSVIVITSSQRSISNVAAKSILSDDSLPDIEILNLDSVTDIEQRLGEGLPNDPELARTLVDQRIAHIGRTTLDTELRAAYLPLSTMMAYGLDRYPVIIFDRQAVIYGVTDLTQAIDQYRQWKQGEQGVTIDE